VIQQKQAESRIQLVDLNHFSPLGINYSAINFFFFFALAERWQLLERLKLLLAAKTFSQFH